MRRPALDDALLTLQPNDTLVIWKLDRLGRNLSHLIVLIEGLEKRAWRSSPFGSDRYG
ncbi:MAG TPA: recombinase family protein [Lacipirellulaceae bacterium]|nr:recombinase family protein [Lacipirellulaceae bacterium]